jgi:peroxiredoxin
MIQRSYWVIDEQGTLIDKKVPVSPGDSVKRALEAVQINVAGAHA